MVKQSRSHKKKVAELYSNIKFTITNSSDVLVSKLQTSVYGERINKKFDEINKLTQCFKNIIENSPSAEELIEQVSIHDLHDVYSVEKKGKVSRITFNEVVNAGLIRKEALKKLEERDKEISLYKISSIELIENQIKALANYLDKKDID